MIIYYIIFRETTKLKYTYINNNPVKLIFEKFELILIIMYCIHYYFQTL